MSKARLMQIATLAAAVSLAACGGTGSDDSATVNTAENTANETVEVVEPDVEEVDAVEPVVEEPTVDWAQQERDYLQDNSTIYFAFDQSNVRDDARETLAAHVGYLLANETAEVILEGHADERGTREYNVALGERRAQAVEAYLKLKGVKDAQIEVTSFGEERPVSTDHALNRRVEVRYQAW